MVKMNQPGTDKGTRGESGEKIPAAARSSDPSGQRKVKVPTFDKEGGSKNQRSETGAKAPREAKASDSSGEKRRTIEGGVAMGMADDVKGRDPADCGHHEGYKGEWNEGTMDSGEHQYRHKKEEYRGDPKKYGY